MNPAGTTISMSVIIVTLNRAQMLKEALESVAAQTRAPEEVVVVDNNSSDNTREIAESFSGRLNMKYIFEPIQGTSMARNTGAKNALGRVLVFMDDDCVAHKEWLHYLELPFMKDPLIGIVGGEIDACRVKGTFIEDFCIDEAMLRIGRDPEKD